MKTFFKRDSMIVFDMQEGGFGKALLNKIRKFDMK